MIDLYTVAVHEAGHAVAHWYLDRTKYLGSPLPRISHASVSLNGEPVYTKHGDIIEDGIGIVAGDSAVCVYDAKLILQESPKLWRIFHKRSCADIIEYFSGPIAECLHLDDPIEWDNYWFRDHLISQDFDAIEERIQFLGRRWRLHLYRAFDMADQIVRDNQPHIHALATALVDRGTIESAEIYDLFDGTA